MGIYAPEIRSAVDAVSTKLVVNVVDYCGSQRPVSPPIPPLPVRKRVTRCGELQQAVSLLLFIWSSGVRSSWANYRY
jgi:hypothetical protein